MLTACVGPVKDAEYESVNDLAAAYEQAVGDGLKCDRTDIDINKSGWVYVNCGPTGFAELFTSDEMRETVRHKNPLKEGQRRLQAKNWVIVADQYQAEKAQELLGGKLSK